ISVLALSTVYLLGPKMLHLLDVEGLSFFVSLLFFQSIHGAIFQNLKQDGENAQSVFLQTLPIKKTRILHAKFLSCLILFWMGIAGVVVLTFINIWINKGTLENMGMALTVVSLFIFSLSITIFRFVVSGRKHLDLTFYSSLIVWVILIIAVNVLLELMSIDFTMLEVISYSLLLSFIIYFSCWALATQIIRKRGFKQT